MRYLVGVCVFPTVARHRVLGMASSPCTTTSVTFVLPDPDRAADCLSVITSRVDYPDALAAALAAGHTYRSAAYGEYQLLSVIRPGDLWACATFHKGGRPLVASGGYGDVARSFAWHAERGRLNDPDQADPAAVFYQEILASIPGVSP